MKATVHKILKGKFLISQGSYKKWQLIFFFSCLALIMIASSHSADSKVHLIAKLNEDVKEMRSSYVETRAKLMELKMESFVRNKMKDRNLIPSKNPPIKILIKPNSNTP